MTRLPLLNAMALAGLVLVAGCAQRGGQTMSKADAGAIQECRSRTEAAFNRQNRYLLSERDTTDSPFSTSGNTGITTQGLSQRYALDTQLSNCIQSKTAGSPQDTGTGATFVGPGAGRQPGNPTQ